jgi:hypothetical protein
MYEQNQPSNQEIKIVIETNSGSVLNANPAGIQVRPATIVPLSTEPTTSQATYESSSNVSITLKSSKPPAHIKDLIYYKYKSDNLSFQPTSSSANNTVTSQQIPSVSIQQTCSSPSTDSDQSSKLISFSSDLLSSKCQKYSETLSPSNLSNSPPLGSSYCSSNSFIKLGAITNLNDSQSSASSTTSNFNSSCDSQAKLQQAAQQLQQQQLKKSSAKKKTTQVTNDLDEERTSQLVSDIIKNIKEKTKELESQNQNLKTLTNTGNQFTESSSPRSVTTPPLANSTVNISQSVVPIMTLNATSPASVSKVNISSPTTFPLGLKPTTNLNSPQNSNFSFSLIQPLNKLSGVFSSSVGGPIFTQIHPIDANNSQIRHFQPISNIITQNLDSSSSEFNVQQQIKKAKKPSASRVKSVQVPLGWSRLIELSDETKEKQVIYKSPTSVTLNSIQEVKTYLLSDNTCKCGLECPFNVNTKFNFDPSYESKLVTYFDGGKKSDSDSCSCQNYSKATEVLETFARQNLDITKKRAFGEVLNNSGGAKRPSSSKSSPAKVKKQRAESLAAVSSPACSDSNSKGFYLQNTQPILLSNVILNPESIENGSSLQRSCSMISPFVTSSKNLFGLTEENGNFNH